MQTRENHIKSKLPNIFSFLKVNKNGGVTHLIGKTLGLVLIITICACTKQKEVRTQLREQERIIFDSLYTAKVATAKERIDTLCKMRREEVFQNAIDSIYEVRISEIENMLDNEQ